MEKHLSEGQAKDLILKHSIEINTTPEKIWDFFLNLEKHYTTWHPKDHILLKWTKGNPLEKGSRCYAEQYVMGKPTKYNTICTEIIENRKIVSKFLFPISLITPKIEWLIEPTGPNSIFTAITYIRFGNLLKAISKKEMKKLISAHDKHVAEEGENLKRILENKDL